MLPEDKRAEEQREEMEQVERCYSRVFQTEDGKKVLDDLRKQCFVDRTTNGEPLLEGRRQVFLHVISRLKMTMTEFYLQRDKKPVQSGL